MEAGAEQRIDDDVASLDRIGLDGLETRLAQDARRDPSVTTIRTVPTHDGEPAGAGVRLHGLAGNGGARPLHQLGHGGRESRVRLLGGTHLGSAAEGLVALLGHCSALEAHDAGCARHRVRMGQ